MRKLKASILVAAATAFCLAQTATEYESPAVMHVAGMLNCNCGCKLRMDCVMPPSGLCPVCKAARMRIANMQKAGTSDAYKTAMSNAGLQADYLNAAAFAKFWAEDAKRSDEAVKLIGRVQG